MLDIIKKKLIGFIYFALTGNWKPVFNEKHSTSNKLSALADYIQLNKEKFNPKERSQTILGLGIRFSKSNVYGITMVHRFSKLYGVTVDEAKYLMIGRFGKLGSKKYPDLELKEIRNMTADVAVEIVRELSYIYMEKEYEKEVSEAMEAM